ncbi:MAG: transketolase [Patescibacteria group bacterium]|nr:transketolase [Patescibacteria group bacterium]
MDKENQEKLKKIAKLLRYYILLSTTEAGSGHPTSSLSSVELLATLFFAGFFRQDLKNPKALYNDRFILSKGHASPLLYSLYTVAGVFTKEALLTLRKFGSIFEGHPSPKFPYAEVATGSLGQGLSIGLGMALGIKLRFFGHYRPVSHFFSTQPEPLPFVFVLLGDSELAEGQVWEAISLGGHYQIDNLVAIVDVSRLGQTAETMVGWNLSNYQKKFEAFNWQVYSVRDGHDIEEIYNVYHRLIKENQPWPKVVLAKTIKGKGISFLEDKEGWHGKVLTETQLKETIKQLGDVDFKIKGVIQQPKKILIEAGNKVDEKTVLVIKKLQKLASTSQSPSSKEKNPVATREAFGQSLVDLGLTDKDIVVLDAETANSTYEDLFARRFPNRFIEVFIAEQNMVSIGVGLACLGFKVFLSSFSAFLTRAFDQIRMAQYSNAHIKIAGSHAGVSIGYDGPSQMGLEDLAMFSSILTSTILYPADKVSSAKLTSMANKLPGIVYLRLTREKTPVIYSEEEEFPIPGLKIHSRENSNFPNGKKILVIAAGITLSEALKAQRNLIGKNINLVVVDLYCPKPLDRNLLKNLIKTYPKIIVVEDHYPEGGIGSLVSKFILEENLSVDHFIHLACRKIPTSGLPQELLAYEEIDHQAITRAALAI